MTETGERITRGPGRGGGASRPQIRKVPKNIVFTKAKQAAFLAELTRTCNVSASARAVGMIEKTVSALRRRNPAFQAAWNAALAEGYVALELKLLEEALHGGFAPDEAAEADGGNGGRGGGDGGHGRPRRPLDVRLALALLKAHRETVAAERARATSPAGSDDEAAARELDAKLDLMAERLAAARRDAA